MGEELPHLLIVQATTRNLELLFLTAKQKMQLQPLGIAILESKQIVDKHRRILCSIAVEQSESTAGFVAQCG